MSSMSRIGSRFTLSDRWILENHQYSAAVGAIREKSILSGHRIERREVGPPDSFDHLTDDELERELIERAATPPTDQLACSESRF
jgi:hypothetical protein